jgi:hypothetical protein
MFVSVPPSVFFPRLPFAEQFLLKMVVFPHKVSHTQRMFGYHAPKRKLDITSVI